MLPEVEAAATEGRWEQMRQILAGEAVRQKKTASSAENEPEEEETPEEFPLADRILMMTNETSKTVIHLAIEHKRYKFLESFFAWLGVGEQDIARPGGPLLSEEEVLNSVRRLLKNRCSRWTTGWARSFS